jgi:hypothetical protein
MRALRIVLIVVVILGGLFVAADRLAVNFAEGEAADKLKTTENLSATPDVSINGFPFLTQVAGGELDDVEVGIDSYEAAAGDGENIRIDDLTAHMKGVEFSSDFGSATAASATGTATIAYDELLKAAKSEPTEVAPGVTARVVSLASTVAVKGDTVEVRTDSLPELAGFDLAEESVREITDFQQAIDDLPGGIRLDKVEAAPDGLEITVRGSNVQLVG